MRVPSMSPRAPGKSGSRKRGGKRGIRIDKSAVARFVKRTERAKRAGVLAQARYIRNKARYEILRKRVAESKKPDFVRDVGYFLVNKRTGERKKIPTSKAVSRPGDPPFTYNWKGRGNMFRRIRYGMLGNHMAIAGADYIKKAKSSSRPTTPAIHEHGGTKLIKRTVTVLHRETMATPTGRQITPGSIGRRYRRSKNSTQAQKNAMYQAMHTGRIQKKKLTTDSYTATYPKRPFMQPAGKKSIREARFKQEWLRAMRRSLGTY